MELLVGGVRGCPRRLYHGVSLPKPHDLARQDKRSRTLIKRLGKTESILRSRPVIRPRTNPAKVCVLRGPWLRRRRGGRTGITGNNQTFEPFLSASIRPSAPFGVLNPPWVCGTSLEGLPQLTKPGKRADPDLEVGQPFPGPPGSRAGCIEPLLGWRKQGCSGRLQDRKWVPRPTSADKGGRESHEEMASTKQGGLFGIIDRLPSVPRNATPIICSRLWTVLGIELAWQLTASKSKGTTPNISVTCPN